MSYNYLTQFSSPNYTPGSASRVTFGQPRTFQEISIHWWDDPAKKPTFEGALNTLCNPASGVSAHFVATGTGRRVACLVNLTDVAWATKQANPWTISIECDPRCRPEDYDVVAELIADIRSAYGNLPLVPHSKYVATRCPGTWDLGRLNALAGDKVSHAKWGEVTSKVILATHEQVAQLYRDLLGREADPGGILTYTQQTIDQARANIMSSTEYHQRQQMLREKAAREEAARAAEKAAADAAAQAEADKKSAALPTNPAPAPAPTPPTPTTPTPVPETPTQNTTTTPAPVAKKPNPIVLLISILIRLLARKKK